MPLVGGLVEEKSALNGKSHLMLATLLTGFTLPKESVAGIFLRFFIRG